MARFARVIAVGIHHCITQRGNARRFIVCKTKRIEKFISGAQHFRWCSFRLSPKPSMCNRKGYRHTVVFD